MSAHRRREWFTREQTGRLLLATLAAGWLLGAVVGLAYGASIR